MKARSRVGRGRQKFAASLIVLALYGGAAHAALTCPSGEQPTDILFVAGRVNKIDPYDYYSYPGGGPFYYSTAMDWIARAIQDAEKAYAPHFHYQGIQQTLADHDWKFWVYYGYVDRLFITSWLTPRPNGWNTVYSSVSAPILYYRCTSATMPNNAKNVGGGFTCANPINPGTGNKFQHDVDYGQPDSSRLRFDRYYSSVQHAAAGFGEGWRHRYAVSIVHHSVISDGHTIAIRPDGKVLVFLANGREWNAADPDISDRLYELNDPNGALLGWRYAVAASEEIETYSADGRLVSIEQRDGNKFNLQYSDAATPVNLAPRRGLLIAVSDDYGRKLKLGYDDQSRIIKLTVPDDGQYLYEYDGPTGPAGANNLTAVTYPDGGRRLYHYNEPENTAGTNLPSALTGITDENGVRYATYKYDSSGRAISTEHAGGADRHSFTYSTNSTAVVDALGTTRTYGFQTILGVVKNTGVSQPGGVGCGAAAESLTYDANGNVASRRDFNGKKSTYSYDLVRNLEVSRTEGLTSAGAALPETRTITTAWHPTWRLPVKVEEFAGASASGTLLRRTEYAYDDRANLTQKIVMGPAAGTTRIWAWTYTYSSTVPGLVLRKDQDGPRTDVADLTTWDYYDETDPCVGCRGNVKQITDALGHVTQITAYDSNGRPLALVDPNNLTTTLAYDLRGRLTSRTMGAQTNTYSYDPVGQLVRLTQPDGSTLSYTYDTAHRLTAIADSLGNKLAYTLDAAGNRVSEQLTDPSGQLKKSLARAYDALGRLQTLTGMQ